MVGLSSRLGMMDWIDASGLPVVIHSRLRAGKKGGKLNQLPLCTSAIKHLPELRSMALYFPPLSNDRIQLYMVGLPRYG
jgi:hypothetical protein